jgi:hypothetical protein
VASLYGVIVTLHNAFGGLTLLLTIAATIVLLATARTTSTASSLILRADLISASIQFVLGLLLVLLGFAVLGAGAVLGFWFHYLLGIASVGVISAFVARARRSPDSEARRYGLLFLIALVVVGITFAVGQSGFRLG